MKMEVKSAAAPATTAKQPAAKVGPYGKPVAPARTGLSDAKIALILAKFGKTWPSTAR